ncbi:MAG: thioredoxin domain-containing protein [Anaerolineae bacterium]|nr:thioredoxin domain-containing protein [Anaerolineae bacterium]
MSHEPLSGQSTASSERFVLSDENTDHLPPSQAVTPIYLVIAAIFFGLGFVLAMILGVSVEQQATPNTQGEIAQAVQATLIALTPPPTPIPTVVPVELTFSEQDYSTGPDNAPITMVEFSDYRCPYCGQFGNETLQPLLNEYDGLIKFVYRDFPIFGGTSIRAAHAAQCADRQGKFWEYHDALFASQLLPERPDLNDDVLLGFAIELGVDQTAFSSCLADTQIEQAIIQNYLAAQSLLGQAGTPTFLINGRRVVGALPLEYFIPILDEELAKVGIEHPSD